MVLASYEVPAGTVREMRSALNGVLGNIKEATETPLGRANITPDGRLLVLAPEKLQAGIHAMVEQASKRPNAMPARVETTVWFVIGKRGGKGATASLQEIQPALDEIVKAQGPMQFRELEQIKVSTLSGEDGKVNGEMAHARQEVTVNGGVVLARLSLNAGTKAIETSVQTRSGQTVVLAQSGWKDGEEEAALFYVIRADIRDAGESR
jgi:hypothetical protein